MSIESGWLIERRKGPVTTWAAATESGFHWTAEAHEAIRFSRRSDAEQVASILGDDVDAICEHQWGPDLVSPPQPETAVIFHLADKTPKDQAAIQYALDQLEELRDVLTSARCIAERQGVNTAWRRFSARIGRLGIGSITAKVFKFDPDDPAS